MCRVYSFSSFFFFSLRAKKTGALILSFKRKQQSLQEDYKRPGQEPVVKMKENRDRQSQTLYTKSFA